MRIVAQGLWIGEELSPFEMLCIRSFLDHGHAFHLYTYGPVRNVPAGCQFMAAEEILPRARVFAYRRGEGKGSFAAFSNLFRYTLLHRRGGWWVDLDMVCLGPQWPAAPVVVCTQDEGQINSAVMAFPAAHPVMAQAMARCAAAGTDFDWGEMGPGLMTPLVEADRDIMAFPQAAFYPVSRPHFDHIVLPRWRESVQLRCTTAYGTHLWNELFRRIDYNKYLMPPAGSYLHDLYARHGLLDIFRATYVITGFENGITQMDARMLPGR